MMGCACGGTVNTRVKGQGLDCEGRGSVPIKPHDSGRILASKQAVAEVQSLYDKRGEFTEQGHAVVHTHTYRQR